MRKIVIALSTIGALAAGISSACAYDLREWSYDWDTRPRAYQYPPAYAQERWEGRRSLRYYCSLGARMPRSLRDDCRRAGYR
jgi:hypothetical protein